MSDYSYIPPNPLLQITEALRLLVHTRKKQALALVRYNTSIMACEVRLRCCPSLERASDDIKQALHLLQADLMDVTTEAGNALQILEVGLPRLMKYLDFSLPQVKDDAQLFLSISVPLMDSISESTDQLQDVRRHIEDIRDMQELGVTQDASLLLVTIDDLLALCNRDWFCQQDMKERFTTALVSTRD